MVDKTPADAVEDIAETTGEVIAEVVVAPVKIAGSFLDRIFEW